MNRGRGKAGIVAIIALAFVVTLTTSITLAGATTVKVDPATQDIMAGEAFSVDVVVENVTGMAACQGVVNFDQSAMQATDIVEGAFLQSAGATVGVEDLTVPGKAIFSYALTTPGSSVTGSGILATINFTADPAAAPGIYPLQLTNVMLLNTTTTPIRIDEPSICFVVFRISDRRMA